MQLRLHFHIQNKLSSQFQFQMQDIKMDWIITEKDVIKTS